MAAKVDWPVGCYVRLTTVFDEVRVAVGRARACWCRATERHPPPIDRPIERRQKGTAAAAAAAATFLSLPPPKNQP